MMIVTVRQIKDNKDRRIYIRNTGSIGVRLSE